MKKTLLCLLSVCLLLVLCSCGKVSVDKNQAVELVFRYGNTSVDDRLSDREAKEILDIFDGKELFFDEPSCGFDDNVSFKINGRLYCPACDRCCTVKDCGSGQYFTVTQTERNTIENIFTSHGGYFPCV